MTSNTAAVYDESKIKTLSSLEHIRMRPGMYIGRLGNGSHPDDGIYILLKEVIDNGVDEFIMGAGKTIEIAVGEDGTLMVRDYGRGIPLGKLVECVSVINTGAKYNTDAFQFSVGLNGVGTKAVNALSRSFEVTSYRDGEFARAVFVAGELQEEEKGSTGEKNGTLVEFKPDPAMFPDYSFNREFIRKRLKRYAYLNAGLHLDFDGESFFSENGLLDLLEAETSGTQLYEPIHFRDKTIEFAFAHTDNYGETYFSFVNGTYTNEGGTHLSAFREGLLKGINEFAGKKFDGEDVREGVVGAVAVKVREPIFESQTKNKLGNTDIRAGIVAVVRDEVSAFLYKNTELAELVIEKIQQSARVRKELQHVRKEAKAKARKVALKIPQLKDCKYHPTPGKPSPPGKENMVFLTEGQSASGSIVSARDPMTQAVFSLKGKPYNVYGQPLATLYKNDEMYNIMRALDIEDSIGRLRFDKIIIATDADVDGLHIRNLILTFFLHYFESLVKRGHIYILETPIYRVRTKEETIYCYSDRERAEAEKKLAGRGKKSRPVEITRFKGLGEISPKEFKQFIGSEMRLQQVDIDTLSEVPRILEFYMGKNTPQRRDYIMAHLV
ncbi:DNA topoisomerase IV subunit B [Desulfurivibrio dismutans]|uniref:DNA topoisomerase IV subunit B n=1 Tax=Desulfurivibrio dismutans TaxID=1398908 RepID=UPI0023DCE737|nr:DNA topoisomerase IV subunit B [Desulfurivibrio alkaliphilus]MDF1614875.1 DNA topoisomerase IV subunit B [Desulfurivibrio alkaliphilus]